MTHAEIYKVVERALETIERPSDYTVLVAWAVADAVWKKWGTLSDS